MDDNITQFEILMNSIWRLQKLEKYQFSIQGMVDQYFNDVLRQIADQPLSNQSL